MSFFVPFSYIACVSGEIFLLFVHESEFFKLFLIYTPLISVFRGVISEVSLMLVLVF